MIKINLIIIFIEVCTEFNEKKIIGIALFSAITASMCCITPVLALLSDTSGMTASFGARKKFNIV